MSRHEDLASTTHPDDAMRFDGDTVQATLDGTIGRITLNRPTKANALDLRMWDELPQALAWLGQQPELRVAVLSGEGRNFCAGIDLTVIQHLHSLTADARCPARGREALLAFIERVQGAFNAIETLQVPVIAAIHGACIGAGVDLIAACDLRLAAEDARFCIKEVDLAVVPDVGTVQRLRHIIGYSTLAQLTYTAATLSAGEARSIGLVSQVRPSQAALLQAATALAAGIAAKSPVAVRGIKRNLLWAREHTVSEGLAYAAIWNAAMLPGEDLRESLEAAVQKRAPSYGL